MTPKLKKAVDNNLALCQAVLRAQSITCNISDAAFFCVDKVPPFFPNVITRSGEWKPDETFESVAAAALREGWGEWGVKDSFSSLDLSSRGFQRLFTARWLYLSTQQFVPHKNEKKLRYEVLRSERGLSAWCEARGAAAKGEEIFNPALLKNSDLYFIAGYEKNKLQTGCLLNRSGEVIGISNFFAPEAPVEYWSGIVSFVHDWIDTVDLVGYEQDPLAESLRQLGYKPEGKLQIWVSRNPER